MVVPPRGARRGSSRSATQQGGATIPRRRRARTRPRRAVSRPVHDVPSLLPASEDLHLTPALLALLSEADHRLGRLRGKLEAWPETELFAPGLELREAMASARLAGTDSSPIRLLRSRFEEDGGEDRAIGAVESCRAAARHARERLGELPIGSRLIRSVHARLFGADGSTAERAGQFRQVEALRSRASPTDAGADSNLPAIPPVPRMREGMQALDDFLESDQEMPPVLACAFVHGHVRRMHPFRRGNGRVARMLIPLLLADADILTRPVLCPSVALERHRATYLERLANLEDTEGREAWLAFFLRLLAEAAVEAEDAVRRLRRMRSEHHARVREGSRSSHAPALLDHLLSTPVTTARAAAEAVDVHYVTANNLIGELEEMGLLREVTGRRRDRIFVYGPCVELLADT